ncbi:MAG: type II toxin-antitoxin system VapC family toxin [Terriglobales bacterium]
MGLYYLETSALVKLYVREPGTQVMLRLTDRAAGHRLALLAMTRVEFRSAVRRREREGDLSQALADRLLDLFEQHAQNRFLSQPVSDPVLGRASALLDQYALRAYDAVQLAGCLVLRDSFGKEQPVFVCADAQLLEAARLEGLAALNPAGP